MSPIAKFIRGLILVAIFIRAMIPAGFMPGMHETGSLFPLVICSGESGTATVYLPANKLPDLPVDHSHHHQHDGASHLPCAFSACFMHGWVEGSPQVTAHGALTRVDAPRLMTIVAASPATKFFFSQGPPLNPPVA